MNIKIFKNTSCEIDASFLDCDKYTFSVLRRIIKGDCELTLTDGKRLMICLSSHLYPVWVWLPDDASEFEYENAYFLVKKHFGFEGYRFNMKYPLAQYFQKRAGDEGYTLKTLTNLLAYRCLATVAPAKSVDGFLEVASEGDLDEAIAFIEEFHNDLSMDVGGDNEYRQKVLSFIEKERFFFWNNGAERVACCTYTEAQELCSVGSVYTKRAHRRRGYAAHLVYNVTNLIIKASKMPVLYTDADYSASNACYMQIGFEPQGGLCTIG